MVREWEKGTPIVIAIKAASQENRLMFWLRTKYYQLINRLSDIKTYENLTGFGLYDRPVMDLVKQFDAVSVLPRHDRGDRACSR